MEEGQARGPALLARQQAACCRGAHFRTAAVETAPRRELDAARTKAVTRNPHVQIAFCGLNGMLTTLLMYIAAEANDTGLASPHTLRRLRDRAFHGTADTGSTQGLP